MQEFISTSFKWKKTSVFLFSFITFLIFNGFTTGWISNVQPSGCFAVSSALLVNSTLMSLTVLMGFFCIQKFGINKGLRSFIALWLMFEFFHLDWDLSWPWLMLGDVFAQKIKWIQWYEYTGVLGGTLWILIVNVLFFYLLRVCFNTKKISFTKLFYLGSVLLFPILGSYIIFNSVEKELLKNNNKVEVVVVQPNEDPYSNQGKFSKTNQEHILTLLELTDSIIEKTTEYILAPETTLPLGEWIKKINQSSSVLLIKNYLELSNI